MTNTKITWEELAAAAGRLGIEPCAMKAVYEVESSGDGFLASGRPKILFEGHVFWKELEKRGLNPTPLSRTHPNIIYQKWTKIHYSGNGEKEYDRLGEALTINEEAALCSASWGAFQIMGFNHKVCGYETVHAFVEAQRQGAAAQLEAFCGFIKSNNLVRHLAARNWGAFAKGYNGPGYMENKYDLHLMEAYSRCAREHKG
ncbi:peptidoglycan-binding protein (plasmid) [Deltaproteobacteria bacterium Smac51]|nr:peptidoglycan-binding protein [Deltaproteobacteria bacterium Smac51]